MHIPALAPLVLLAATFLPLWFWPRYWLATAIAVAWFALAIVVSPTAEALMRIAGIAALAFGVVAFRRNRLKRTEQ